MFACPCWKFGRLSETAANSRYESRSLVSWVSFCPSRPLMWQVAQVGRRQRLRVGLQVHRRSLAVEEHAVLRLVVDLDLRVVRAHVALSAGLRRAGQLHRAGVAGVAGGARADRAVGVGPADVVALL